MIGAVALGWALVASPAPPSAAARPSYFVRLRPEIADDRVASTAHALGRAHQGRVQVVNLRGFQVEMSDDSARALLWDERVETVARFPQDMDRPPPGRFVGTSSRGARHYRVMLADSARRYDQARVVEVATQLAKQYQATVVGAFARSVGRPWAILNARPPQARAMSRNWRVAWVAERSGADADVSSEIPLVPLRRGGKRPAARVEALPEPRRGSVLKVDRRYKDWYFVVLDPARTDVSAPQAIAALADELSAASDAQRIGGEFSKPPQGFRFSGTPEAALRIAGDPRVKWVEEVGPLLRSPDPRPGEYGVVLSKAATSGADVIEELAAVYGGRVAWNWHPLGFAVEDMATESAIALSRDLRVEFVEEGCCIGPTMDPLPTATIDVR